jgi:hypothetical protein
MRIGLIACVLLAFTFPAAAQNTGELWEITMAIPGMPAGMMKPQRVCQGDDPSRAATQDPSKKDCKVTGSKKTATSTTVTMSCADGSTMTIDQQFNAARTEFKSTMTSKGGRQGEMTINTTGRKVGACDAVATRKEQDAKVDAMKKQAAAGAAAGAAAVKQSSDQQIKQCTAAAEKMEYTGLGIAGQCYAKKNDKQCKEVAQAYPEVSKTCGARVAEFCKRLQTPDGFMKASGRENAAQMCGVSVAAIKAAQCPKAAQGGSLAFLGAYCPAEAKPIAMEHCGGRDYTSKMGGKYSAFCTNYLANADFERPPGAAPARPAAAKSAAGTTQEAQDQPQSAQDQVKQGVSKGFDKIKGLFGR